MEEAKRSREIDVLRGLAIASVLIIHVTADYAYADGRSLTYGIMNFINKLFYAAVPVFVALTVYLGLKSGKKRGAVYVLQKCGRILLLYVI
ncbi:MAG: acyltransferase family protein, partial [Clostridia bacterium]